MQIGRTGTAWTRRPNIPYCIAVLRIIIGRGEAVARGQPPADRTIATGPASALSRLAIGSLDGRPANPTSLRTQSGDRQADSSTLCCPAVGRLTATLPSVCRALPGALARPTKLLNNRSDHAAWHDKTCERLARHASRSTHAVAEIVISPGCSSPSSRGHSSSGPLSRSVTCDRPSDTGSSRCGQRSSRTSGPAAQLQRVGQFDADGRRRCGNRCPARRRSNRQSTSVIRPRAVACPTVGALRMHPVNGGEFLQCRCPPAAVAAETGRAADNRPRPDWRTGPHKGRPIR